MRPHILIVGDLILDVNYIGSTNRIAPEAPIPVTKIDKIEYNLGGALNIASNLASMGNLVVIAGVVGNDIGGQKIIELLKEKSIDTKYIIIDNKRPTTTKHRIFSGTKLVSRFDIETNSPISRDTHNKIIEFIKLYGAENSTTSSQRVVILSDYLKGVLTYELTQEIIQYGNMSNILTFVDPKDTKYSKYNGCTLIKPNKAEGELIIGRKILKENLDKDLNEIRDRICSKYCLLTLSEDGMCILGDTIKYYPIINKKNVIDVTGAGDTVLSSFVHHYIRTNDIYSSTEFSNYCGQLKVSRMGTYAVTPYDIIQYNNKNSKHVSINDIGYIADILRKTQKIIFTNGCFDVLHYGHLTYLEEAKQQGDILIIGLNSDNSIKRTKGHSRPFNKENYRVKHLEMLSLVDFIVVFEDDTPLELIKLVKPDILVKGGDYNIDTVIGKEYAKEVKILGFVENISTTKILTYSQSN